MKQNNMNHQIMRTALRKRRGKKFDTKGFLDGAKAGVDSDDLKEDKEATGVVLGDGVRDMNLKQSSGSDSSDDLAPSRQEMRHKKTEMSKETEDGQEKPTKKIKKDEMKDLKNSIDEDIFDADQFRKAKKKKNPSNLFERMQLALGMRMNKE